MTTTDVETYTATRRSLQAVAEHVLSAARYGATGRIGLRQAHGGFATPPYPSPAGRRRLWVEGTELAVIDAHGERRRPLTTLREAADFAEVDPGAPGVYRPGTPLDLDAPLVLDAVSVQRIAAWYELGQSALEWWCESLADESPADIQLWPEHFDLATTISSVNYGVSPGDDGHPLPYLYVGPHEPPPRDEFWNEPYGASLTEEAVTGTDDAIAFFREGRRRLST